ncbi:MAG: TlpA family protein disulfide reductase [Lachnospiraceae bacterium]|nr:TlpA family protein disulfide reductase [Lachnospiraceae bacterium]
MRAERKQSKMLVAMALFMTMMMLAGCGNTDNKANAEKEQTTTEVFVDVESMLGGAEAEPSVPQEVFEGDVAPEFSAPLVNGSTFTLSENSGKVILLNFWATWCGPCVGEMPAFQKLYEEYDEEIVILAVNCMEESETVDQFVKDNGYTFPVAYDVEGMVSMAYPSSGIPYTLVIGTDGVVKNIYVGAADADTQYQVYKAAIDAALAE